MGDVTDVSVENKKKEIVAEDNIRAQEVLRGYRILYFNDDHFIARRFNVKSIRIYDKSPLFLSKYGDEMFTRMRNRLVKDEDMLTYQEQMDYLKRRGQWDDNRETRLNELREKTISIIEERSKKTSKMQTATKPEDLKKLTKDIEALRDKYNKLSEEFAEMVALHFLYFKDTIEMQAEVAQRKGWIVSTVCLDEGGDKYDPEKRLWKSVEELERDLKEADYTVLIMECVNYWDVNSGGGESFFAESPEELTSDSDGDTPEK